ncbi:MAG: hypothetical protein KJ720_06000 [Proteobacteria bacterium]|nr:hypothetical protein [Pseudomonadota bacterium]MBU1452272.1 hypothetical protein [Pseudomonadota bacterium]MBU2470016.1 hypothetical protein [Pseudomonadota bacterium]MBU2519445.1 hypothetical protein [Pseudomonadota bacterium]
MRIGRACAALTMLLFTLAWVSPAAAGDNPFKMAPPFKSAIIKYKYEGTQSGQATTYYKGSVQAEHKKVATNILGMGSEDNTITITEPQRITSVDLKKGEAFYTGNYMTYMAQEYDKLSSAEKKTVKKNAEAMGKNFMGMMGGKPQIRQGTFMNRPVDIVKVMGLTSYTWQGKQVVLKQEGGIMGMQMNMTATSIKTGVPVPADKLQVPAGMKAVFNKEADQQQKDMAKRVMGMLKDPEFGKKQGQALEEATRKARQEQDKQAPASGGEASQAPSGDSSSGQENQGDVLQKGLDAAKKIFKW